MREGILGGSVPFTCFALPLIDSSAISLMYIGRIPQNMPQTMPPMNLATYSIDTLVAKVVSIQDTIQGTEKIIIVNFLPNKSANKPAGKLPIRAPNGISAAIISFSRLFCSLNGAE